MEYTCTSIIFVRSRVIASWRRSPPEERFFLGSVPDHSTPMAPPTITRAVRLLSTMHSLRKSGSGTLLTANLTIFSKEHFPKFLMATSLFSVFSGFYFMEYLRNRAVSRSQYDDKSLSFMWCLGRFGCLTIQSFTCFVLLASQQQEEVDRVYSLHRQEQTYSLRRFTISVNNTRRNSFNL